MMGIHSRRVNRATPPGLAKPVAVLASRRVSPTPTAHDRPVDPRLAAAPPERRPPDRRWPPRGTPRPSPTPRRRRATSAGSPSPPRGGVVGRAVRCDEHRTRQRRSACESGSPSGSRTRGLVRRGGDDLAGTARIAVPADHHRRPASSGRLRTSTAARNWSRSTCSTQAASAARSAELPICTAALRRRACGDGQASSGRRDAPGARHQRLLLQQAPGVPSRWSDRSSPAASSADSADVSSWSSFTAAPSTSVRWDPSHRGRSRGPTRRR
jgi:hypothetical protein